MLAPVSADASAQRRAWAYTLVGTLAVVVAVRVFILAVGFVASATAEPHEINPRYSDGQPWISFDSVHYRNIVDHGYPGPDFVPKEIAFFPAVPLVAGVIAKGVGTEAALVLLSNLCTVVAFGFMYDFCRRVTSARTAFWACLVLATFPAAVFFSAGETEGPFFLCAAVILWLLQRERFWTAAIVCAVATAVRPTGVALAATVVCWTWAHHLMRVHPQLLTLTWGRRVRDAVAFTFRPAVLGRLTALGLLCGTGIMCYQGYLWARYERFDAYFQAQSYWHPDGLKDEQSEVVWREIREREAREVRDVQYYLRKAMTPQAWNRGLLLLVVGATVWGLVRPGSIPRAAFVLPLVIFLMCYLPSWGLRASSIARYETPAVPVFLLLACGLLSLRRTSLAGLFVAAQLAMQVYYAFLFSRATWIG